MKQFTFPVLPFVAFISGFALMTFELAAARVLAPSIGSSTYVWTSVIGVIIAALSLGYWTGGKLADRRHRSTDIAWLLLAIALTVVMVLLLYLPVLDWVAQLLTDARFQGVLASLMLFAPTSYLLGVLAPYLVKLKITTLETSGSSFASLSAMESIGGITGTFVTGFVLFSYIGSRETFVVVALLLVATSWLLQPRRRWVIRGVLTASVVSVCLLALGVSSEREIDTPSAHYSIVDGVTNGEQVRGLMTGPGGTQSGVYLHDSDRLLFWYAQQMADVVAAAPQQEKILVLGGGTFTLPRYLAQTYPDSTIDVVEIDPELAQVARQYFFYDDPANVRLIFDDARRYVNQATTEYDVILVDVYADVSVPFSLMTEQFGQQLARITAPDGVVAANMIVGLAGACKQAYQAFDAPYRAQFDQAVFRMEYPDQFLSNVVTVYSRQPLHWLATPVSFAAATPYTDNYAPAERIQQACRLAQNAE